MLGHLGGFRRVDPLLEVPRACRLDTATQINEDIGECRSNPAACGEYIGGARTAATWRIEYFRIRLCDPTQKSRARTLRINAPHQVTPILRQIPM